MKKVLILYFSAAGSTMRVARVMAQKLQEHCDVHMLEVDNCQMTNLDGYDALIVGTPVFHGAPARAVTRFFDQIAPRKNVLPAFIFSTHGLTSLNTNRILARQLAQKNIITIHDASYLSPASDGVLIAPFIKQFRYFEKGIRQKINLDVARFVTKLGKGDYTLKLPRFTHLGILNAPNAAIGKRLRPTIHIIDELCNQCGLCGKICPHNKCEIDPSCEYCFKCVHNCSQGAMTLFEHRPAKVLLGYNGKKD